MASLRMPAKFIFLQRKLKLEGGLLRAQKIFVFREDGLFW